jgi:hypothetical protein
MPLVHIPSAWLLVMPCGCLDGWYVGVRSDGTIVAADEEAAWGKFAPSKKERRELEAEGWTVRAKNDDETSANVAGCTCEEK